MIIDYSAPAPASPPTTHIYDVDADTDADTDTDTDTDTRHRSQRRDAPRMAGLPLTFSLPVKLPSEVARDGRKFPRRRRLGTPRVATIRRIGHPTDDLDAYQSDNLSAWPRQRHGLTGDGSRPSHPPPALVRGLAAAKHFFFAEDKSLYDEYTPNYRCARLFPSPHISPSTQFPLLTPCQLLAHPQRPNRPFRYSP